MLSLRDGGVLVWGRWRTGRRNPNAPSPPPPPLHWCKNQKWGVFIVWVCDCQWKMFCLVRLINQEKGESVSMHTVASHMAYWEASFLFFFFFFFSPCLTKCFKCFIKYNKMRNITYLLLFSFFFKIALIATNGVMKKKGKKKDFKDLFVFWLKIIF